MDDQMNHPRSNIFRDFIRKHDIIHRPARVINRFITVTRKKIWFTFVRAKRSCFKKNRKFCDFGRLKDQYLGKRCFIVCTGPSLQPADLDKLKDEICFGMNNIFKIFGQTEWRPTYYCVIDEGVYSLISDKDEFQNIKNALMPDTFVKKFKKLTLKNYIQFPFDDNEFAWHHLTNAPIKFTENAEILVYDAATVTFALMQIAVFMGFKQIYLLGCDCNYSGPKQHFSEYGLHVNNALETEEDLILAYKAAKEYADSHGIKIYNATRGGKLEVFERVDFDRLFQK